MTARLPQFLAIAAALLAAAATLALVGQPNRGALASRHAQPLHRTALPTVWLPTVAVHAQAAPGAPTRTAQAAATLPERIETRLVERLGERIGTGVGHAMPYYSFGRQSRHASKE